MLNFRTIADCFSKFEINPKPIYKSISKPISIGQERENFA